MPAPAPSLSPSPSPSPKAQAITPTLNPHCAVHNTRRTRIGDPYVLAKATGLKQETIRLLTFGAPYFFLPAEMHKLFDKFISDEGLASYFIRHTFPPHYT